MMNWKYVAPRLALLAAAVVAVWLGLDPLVRMAITTLGSRLLGAKVEVGEARTSLAKTELRLANIALANPKAPLENLLEAKDAVLALETGSLLKKQFVVREGRISGLKFGGARINSGTLEDLHVSAACVPSISVDADRFAALASNWLKISAATLRQDLEQELESVRLAKELVQRWPAEYEALATRADALQRRIKELKKLVENPDHNGLASFEAYRQAAAEMDAVREELTDLRNKLKQLPRQAERDKEALAAAERRDLEHLRRKFLLDRLNAETLSEYLLGPEHGKQADELMAWLRWARQFMPAEANVPTPIRGRGETVLFSRAQNTPDFFIRSLRLDGEAKVGSELVRFEGEATGLTSQPKLSPHPATFTVRTEGATPLVATAQFDRTGEIPHDTLEIVCPNMAQPRRVLGRPDQLAVAVSPGKLQLRVRLDLRGDALTGRATLVQEPVELVPTLAAKLGGERLARGVSAATSRVRRLDATLDLSGTLEKPEFKLSSNLGPELAAGVQAAFQHELDVGREELAQQAEQYISGQLARLERLLAVKEQEVAAKLNVGDQDLAQLSRRVASRAGLPEQLRVPKLPGVDLFKR